MSGRPPGRGPVETARALTHDEDWTMRLSLAIVMMAVYDYRREYYRAGVESFFRGRLFQTMFDLDGEAVLRGLRLREMAKKG